MYSITVIVTSIDKLTIQLDNGDILIACISARNLLSHSHNYRVSVQSLAEYRFPLTLFVHGGNSSITTQQVNFHPITIESTSDAYFLRQGRSTQSYTGCVIRSYPLLPIRAQRRVSITLVQRLLYRLLSKDNRCQLHC